MRETQTGRAEGRARDERFVDYLRGLVSSEDLAALAALRRGLGKEPGTAPEMYPYVVPFLPDGLQIRVEASYYLVGSLFAWHQNDWTGDRWRTNLGASLAQLRKQHAEDRGKAEPDQGDSTERRFVALLSSTLEDLPYHLRQMVGLLRTKEVSVNWLQLLRDIQDWERDDRRVQRRWAGAFWRQTLADQSGDQAPELPNRFDESNRTNDESVTY